MPVSKSQIYAGGYSGRGVIVPSALSAVNMPAQAAAKAQAGLANSEAVSSGAVIVAQEKSSIQPVLVKSAQSEQVRQAASGQKAPVRTDSVTQKAQDQDSGNFPPFDTSYFASHILWLAVCFGFFYFFMARVVLPRIGGVIETRRDRIAADLDQAARMKSEADAAIEAYRKSLNDARDQAKAIARMAAEEAKAKANAERKAVEGELERKLAEAEGHVTAFRDKALAEVDNITRDIAAGIVQKISGRKADKTALAQAVKIMSEAGGAV